MQLIMTEIQQNNEDLYVDEYFAYCLEYYMKMAEIINSIQRLTKSLSYKIISGTTCFFHSGILACVHHFVIWCLQPKCSKTWSKRSSQVSSKFGVYKFRVFSKYQLVTAYLLFLSIVSRLSMIKSLYLHIVGNRRIEQIRHQIICTWLLIWRYSSTY